MRDDKYHPFHLTDAALDARIEYLKNAIRMGLEEDLPGGVLPYLCSQLDEARGELRRRRTKGQQ